MTSFSQRQGLDVPDADIVVRQEAPMWLRELVISYAYEAGFKPSELREILCQKLMETPNAGNWSQYPNIDLEVHELMWRAPWFFVYDMIELLYIGKAGPVDAWDSPSKDATEFAEKINRAFWKKGVGWQLVDRQIQVRGPEVFEQTLRTAVDLATKSNREVARNELHEALRDLSRRPEAELTGAIQHAMAALECVARDVTKQPTLTFGAWLSQNPQAFPAPLNAAVEKLWGYSSEYGRHVREGRLTTFDEAEMVVGIAGSLAVYLLRKS